MGRAGRSECVLDVGSSPGVSDLVVSVTGTPLTSFTATGVGAGTCFVRGRAKYACGRGAASNEATVVVPCERGRDATSGLHF